jgi:hypothetical protein
MKIFHILKNSKLIYYLLQLPIIIYWTINCIWWWNQQDTWSMGPWVNAILLLYPFIYFLYYNIKVGSVDNLITYTEWGAEGQCFHTPPGNFKSKLNCKKTFKSTTDCGKAANCKTCEKKKENNFLTNNSHLTNCYDCKKGYTFVQQFDNCSGVCVKTDTINPYIEGTLNWVCQNKNNKNIAESWEHNLNTKFFYITYAILLLGLFSTSRLFGKKNQFNNPIIRHFASIIIANNLIILAMGSMSHWEVVSQALSIPLTLLYSTSVASLLIVLVGFFHHSTYY